MSAPLRPAGAHEAKMERMTKHGRAAPARPPDGRATMQDVATQAGVSVSTVSKVLNGRYGVASATSAHVNEVIQRLGYEASLVAQSLRNRRTNVIGVLVSDFEPFSVEVLKGPAAARAYSDPRAANGVIRITTKRAASAQ